MYLVGLFEDAKLCAIHAKRVTIMPKVGDEPAGHNDNSGLDATSRRVPPPGCAANAVLSHSRTTAIGSG